MSQKAIEWLEWLTRASLPVVAVTLMGMYVQIERQTLILNNHAKELTEMKTEMAWIKATYVSRPEMTDTLKRVEQQLEIMMLRSKQRDK
jgi:hypothetical protein